MMRIKLSLQRIATVYTLSLALLTSYYQPLAAQPFASASSHLDNKDLHFKIPLPPNQGAPYGRRRGGASRGLCQKYQDLTALVPMVGESVGGLATAEHPTFWFFVPQPLTPDFPVEFVLQDEADNYVYKTTLTIAQTQAGVVSLSIPPTVAPLEIGKSYYWTLSIYCDPAKVSASVSVQGMVQRVSLDSTLESQVEKAMPRERVALYAANGIWYEALTTLAELHRIQPNDSSLAAAWTELLQQVGLQAIAPQPIIECCKNLSGTSILH